MSDEEILNLINQLFAVPKGRPYGKITRMMIRGELEKALEGKNERAVGDYILRMGRRPNKNYVQIYTKESWERAKEFWKKKLIPIGFDIIRE